MMSPIAITRAISPSLNQCELTHLARQPIDIDLAVEQHHAYEAALAELGCRVISLPAEPALPDSVFVEDCAIVVDELAIITRPGADTRKPETATIAAALAPYRALHVIEAPGTLDGGDVLRVGKAFFVGLSSRSNQAAIDQMRAILGPHGYTVTGVHLTECLHLKSAVTQVGPNTLLLNPAWVSPAIFDGYEAIEVDPSEPGAANAVLIGDTILFPAAFPETRRRLESRGIQVKIVDASEVAKAEGAVTCCSLIFNG